MIDITKDDFQEALKASVDIWNKMVSYHKDYCRPPEVLISTSVTFVNATTEGDFLAYGDLSPIISDLSASMGRGTYENARNVISEIAKIILDTGTVFNPLKPDCNSYANISIDDDGTIFSTHKTCAPRFVMGIKGVINVVSSYENKAIEVVIDDIDKAIVSLSTVIKNSRDKSIALTHLEDAKMRIERLLKN